MEKKDRMLLALSQIDISKLEREWHEASQEECARIKKRSKRTAHFFSGVSIVGIVTAIILFLGVWTIQFVYKENDFILLTFVTVLFLFSVIFYPIRCKSISKKYKNPEELIIRKKNAFLIRVMSVKNAKIVLCGTLEAENEIKICTFTSDASSVKLRWNYKPGDCLSIVEASNGILDVNGKNNYEHLQFENRQDASHFEKKAERTSFVGNDYRKIDFYIKQTSEAVIFLAVQQRLDRMDGAVILSLNRYFVEPHPSYDQCQFEDFMKRMLYNVRQMQEHS